MADEENEEPKKKSGLVKILLFIFAGILLVAVGLGVGYFIFGNKQPDPSEEIDAIIEKPRKRQKLINRLLLKRLKVQPKRLRKTGGGNLCYHLF